MSEPVTQTLKDQAMGMLQSLITTATQTGEFLKEQIPLVVKELLAYNTAFRIAEVAAGAMLITAALLWLRFSLRKHTEAGDASRSRYYDGAWAIGGIIGTTISGLIGVMMFGEGTLILLKITLAPRVWLIEYAAGLVK